MNDRPSGFDAVRKGLGGRWRFRTGEVGVRREEISVEGDQDREVGIAKHRGDRLDRADRGGFLVLLRLEWDQYLKF